VNKNQRAGAARERLHPDGFIVHPITAYVHHADAGLGRQAIFEAGALVQTLASGDNKQII